MTAKRQMPGRPSQHVIDEKAQQMLRATIPVEWVLHERTSDYGIDYVVEIFEDGHATGMEFALQLKGKGQVRGGSVSVPIKRTTLVYWKANELPVLVLVCDVGSGRRWFRWVHHIDLYTSKSKPTSTKVSVKLPGTDLWDDEHSVDAVRSEVASVRALRRVGENLPISISFVDEHAVSGIETRRVVGAVRRNLLGHPELSFPATPDTVLAVIVETREHEVIIELRGTPSIHLHYDSFIGAVPDVDARLTIITADISAAIAFHLASLSLAPLACDILAVASNDSIFLRTDPRAVTQALTAFVHNHRVDAITDYLNKPGYLESSESDVAITVLTKLSSALNAVEQKTIVSRLLQTARVAIPTRGAILAYNAASFVRGTDVRSALETFELAGEIDPSYKSRHYWWNDVGACHFHLDEMQTSANCYEMAVALGDPGALPLQADALLYAGKYEESRRLFGQVCTDKRAVNPEWRVKLAALDVLCDRFDITDQDRDPQRASESWLAADGRLDGRLAGAYAAIDADLLFLPALLEVAANESSEGRPYWDLVVIAALTVFGDPAIWLDAIGAAATDVPRMLEDTVYCARQHCEEPIKSFLYESEGFEELLPLVQEMFASLPRRPDAPFTLRKTEFGSSEFESETLN